MLIVPPKESSANAAGVTAKARFSAATHVNMSHGLLRTVVWCWRRTDLRRDDAELLMMEAYEMPTKMQPLDGR